jgi:DNA-binding NarL/FixJ family response regulator
MIRILIADDHAIVRQGLKQIVQDESDIVVADEASTGKEVLSSVRNNEYDVILLDITMPGTNGLDILKTLKLEKPDLPILMLSMHPEEQYAIRCIKAGAAGYLTKESAPEELIAAIRKVKKGGKYISTTLAEKLAIDLEAPAENEPHHLLSDREYQVMMLIARGERLRDIANTLFISEKTVSTYRSRILEKMRLNSNSDLTKYAIEHRLVQ